MSVLRFIAVLNVLLYVAIPVPANAVVSSFDSRLFTLGMSAQTHRRVLEGIEVGRVHESPIVVVAPAIAQSSARRVVSSLGMFWDAQGLGNVATDRSDYRSELRAALTPSPAVRRVDFDIVSYFNGTVSVAIPEIGVDLSTAFESAAVSAEQIFDSLGNYIFANSEANRSATLSADVLPGTYQLTFTPSLTSAIPGLVAECDFSSGAFTVPEGSGPFTVQIRCGVPTKKLTEQQLQAAQSSRTAQVLTGPELFSVCLGNGGADMIYGPLSNGTSSQIGGGVNYVEDLLELPALQNSGGDGIDLNCAGMGNVSFGTSVVDEPLWSYLVGMDVLRRLDLSGDLEYSSPSIGGYGDPEIISLLIPYQPLINSAPTPYGALPNTPTHRLQFLNFSFNSFNDPAWSDLWRISDSDNYSVGDALSSNNSRQYYSFAVQRDATPEALSRIQAHPVAPFVELDGSGNEGFVGPVTLPLTETGGIRFGPFDVQEPFFENVSVNVFDVPDDVVCTINGQNTDFVLVSPVDFTGYGGASPILISCEEVPVTTGIAGRRL